MASIRKHEKSRFWYACITDSNGKQRQYSTGLENKDDALASAVAAETALRRQAGKPHQLRQALARLADDFAPPESGTTDVGNWLTDWADQKNGRVSPATLSTYRNTMADASAWLATNKITSFALLTSAVVGRLHDFWAGKHSSVTANTKLKHLRIALSTAVKRHMLPDNPADDIDTLREVQTPRRPFTPQEISILLPHLQGEWRAIFFLGLFTGQRLNDIAGLRWQQINLIGANPSITLTTHKTGRFVQLPLMLPALDALAEIPSSDIPTAPVFPEVAALASSTRSNSFRRILARAGLATSPKGKKRKSAEPVAASSTKRKISQLSFHSLRHTATTMLKSAGVSDSIARAIIGHESVAVSRAYTHLDIDTMRSALQKMADSHILE